MALSCFGQVTPLASAGRLAPFATPEKPREAPSKPAEGASPDERPLKQEAERGREEGLAAPTVPSVAQRAKMSRRVRQHSTRANIITFEPGITEERTRKEKVA